MKTSKRHQAWIQASIIALNQGIKAKRIDQHRLFDDREPTLYDFQTRNGWQWRVGLEDRGFDEIIMYFAIQPRQWRPDDGLCWTPYSPKWADLYGYIWIERQRGFYLQTLTPDGKEPLQPTLRCRREMVTTLSANTENPLGFNAIGRLML